MKAVEAENWESHSILTVTIGNVMTASLKLFALTLSIFELYALILQLCGCVNGSKYAGKIRNMYAFLGGRMVLRGQGIEKVSCLRCSGGYLGIGKSS